MSYTPATHEPYAGKDLGSLHFVCTSEMVDHYCEGLAVDRGLYSVPTHWVEPVAPSMIVGEVDGGFDGEPPRVPEPRPETVPPLLDGRCSE